MNIHELLISLLQCISQLLYRIGQNIQLTPKKLSSLLYQKNAAVHGAPKEPKDFFSCRSVMLYSRQNVSVIKAINTLSSISRC